MAEFEMKRNDVFATLNVALKNPDGSPHNLAGASAVTLHIEVADGVFTRPMSVDDSTNGLVSYQWVTADWSAGTPKLPTTRGAWRMEYEVTTPSGPHTFPTKGHDVFKLSEDLA